MSPMPMAGLKGRLSTEGAFNLAASTTKTVLQLIAASNHRVLVTRIELSFQGVSAVEPPVLVDILRQTSAGTATAATPRKLNDSDDETLQTTGSKNATVEPTAGDILENFYVHPQGGIVLDFPDPIPVKGGGRLGLRCTPGGTPATLPVQATIYFDE